MKQIIAFVVALVLTIGLPFAASADSVIPMASEIVMSAAVNLSSSGMADFRLVLFDKYDAIKVSRCTLQVLNSSGKWETDKSLPAPTDVERGVNLFSAFKDYSNYCTSGKTYRLYAVFSISEHSYSMYSPSTKIN